MEISKLTLKNTWPIRFIRYDYRKPTVNLKPTLCITYIHLLLLNAYVWYIVLVLGLVVNLSTCALAPNCLGGYIQMSKCKQNMYSGYTLSFGLSNWPHLQLTHASRLSNLLILISCKSKVIDYLGSYTNMDALGANTYILV